MGLVVMWFALYSLCIGVCFGVQHVPRLSPGDTVAFVSPCSPPCDLVTTNCPDGFKSDVEQQMASFGLNVVWGKFAFDKDEYLAGDDEERAADLNSVFADPSVRSCFFFFFFFFFFEKYFCRSRPSLRLAVEKEALACCIC